MRTWIIGSAADCDRIVGQPTVSGHHCRLSEAADGFFLEDLGSSNGTYINGVRIVSATRISASDIVTLGLTVPMPWPELEPSPVSTVIRIGRLTDNDVVVDDPRVSGHHARLVVEGSRARIEDLGSSNGTFVNSPDQRVTQAVAITEFDTVYLGSLAVPASRLFAPRPKLETAVPPPISPPSPAPEPIPLPVPEPAPTPLTTAPGFDRRWAILLLIQAPVLAILIVLTLGQQAVAAVAQGVAATTFALGLAAIWLGGSLAVWASVNGRREDTIEARSLASPGARIMTLLALCVLQCAVLLTIVHWGSGLKGDWLAMFGVMLLGSGVGLSFGLVVFALSRSPVATAGVLLLSLLPMIALGGWIRPLRNLSPAVRPMAEAMPSRWVFEGLLLLETDRHTSPEELEPNPDRDPSEDVFPSESERMGVTADAMALGLMLIGLTAVTAFVSWGSSAPHACVAGD